MAVFKLTAKRGGHITDVVRSSGTSIAGSDAVEVNIDVTNASKLDVVMMLKTIIAQILTKGFPQ